MASFPLDPTQVDLYESIKKEPFKIPLDDSDDLVFTFFNPDKEGWLLKQVLPGLTESPCCNEGRSGMFGENRTLGFLIRAGVTGFPFFARESLGKLSNFWLRMDLMLTFTLDIVKAILNHAERSSFYSFL